MMVTQANLTKIIETKQKQKKNQDIFLNWRRSGMEIRNLGTKEGNFK